MNSIDISLALEDAQAHYRGVRQRQQEQGLPDKKPFFMSKQRQMWLNEQAELARLQIEYDRVRNQLRALEFGLDGKKYQEQTAEMQYKKVIRECEVFCIHLFLYIA